MKRVTLCVDDELEKLGYDQVRYVHGVERAPEQRVHAGQEGVAGVADVAGAAGQLRSSPAALG